MGLESSDVVKYNLALCLVCIYKGIINSLTIE